MKIRSTFAVIFGVLTLSDGAFALSCAKPDIIKSLEDAKNSDKVYHVFVGKFTPNPTGDSDWSGPLGPKVLHPGGTSIKDIEMPNKSPKTIQSWFEGISLSKNPNHDSQLTRFPVDIQMTCSGMWCGSPPSSSRDVLAFVEARGEQAPVLKISPCPKWVFTGNIPAYAGNVRYCLDKDCTGLQLRSPDAYTPSRPH
ncbi:MAG: hypothetical protein ABJG88_03705 [Litorimonas sp.]